MIHIFKSKNSFNRKVKQQESTEIPLQNAIQKLDKACSVAECMEIVCEFRKMKKMMIEHYFSCFKQKDFYSYFENHSNGFTIEFYWEHIKFGFLLHVLCLASQNEHKHIGIFEKIGFFTRNSISSYLEKDCGVPEDICQDIAMGCIVMCTHSHENLFLSSNPLTSSARSFIEHDLKLDIREKWFGYPDILIPYNQILHDLTNSDQDDTTSLREIKKMLNPYLHEQLDIEDLVVVTQ